MSSPISPIQSSSIHSSQQSAIHSRSPSLLPVLAQPPSISQMRRLINGVKWFGATFLPGIALTTGISGAYKLS